MTAATVSLRAATVTAASYDDFPVGPGQLDLRGDNSPPLTAAVTLLSQPGPTAHDVASYGDVAGDPSLRGTLGELFGVPADHVLVTAGGSEALFLALACAADPGETVMLPRPAFPGFDQLARFAGLQVVHYDVPGVPPRRRHGEPVVVCTPHNPTGVVTAPGIALRDDGWTIWDVSHMSVAGNGVAHLTADLADHDIVVFSLSKLLRLPGIRVGCLITADPALHAAAIRVKTHLSMSASWLGQHLALHVLRAPSTARELGTRTACFAESRTQVIDAAVASGNLNVAPATGGTHVFLRTRDGSNAWDQLAAVGVIGIPGTVFNATSDTVRLCIAQPPEIIAHAARQVKRCDRAR